MAAPKKSIQDRFEVFDDSHPDVYHLFRKFATELKAAGRKKFGARMIYERIRWYYATSSSGESPKLNDNYISRYARKLMMEYPEFTTFFDTRKLKA